MDNRTENVDESMKNSSANSTAPTAAGAATRAELPAPANVPGLTSTGGNAQGVTHGNGVATDGFTLVTRSKRRSGVIYKVNVG